VGVIDGVSWLFAIVFAGWAVVRLGGIERGFPLVQLMAFTPYAALGALVTAGATALTGRWAPAAVGAVAAVALFAVVLPRAIPGRGAAPTGRARRRDRAGGARTACGGEGARLRVMTANLLVGTADPETLVTHVKVDDVEVLALQELSQASLDALDAAGIRELLPYRAVTAVPRYHGSGLLSRHPLSEPETRTHPCGATQTAARLSVPGAGDIVVESAHPCAPYPLGTSCWAHNLRSQPPATPDGDIRVLLGDFNATLDHAELRQVIASGYRDAAADRGAGFRPTWPFHGWWVPWVTIDHVFVDRRVAVTAYATRPLPGSDHRAILAELLLPPT